MQNMTPKRKRELHEKMLYPTIRVSSHRSTGSGTIIASLPRTEPDADGDLGFSVYALTNHHVVSSSIRVEESFDPQRGKKVLKDYRDLVRVEAFKYKNLSSIVGQFTADAKIMAYHAKRDIALLRLRLDETFPHVAKLIDVEDARKIHAFDPIWVVGSGLGQAPFPTSGTVSNKNIEIDHFPYWQGSAPAIFGNSGGAVFLDSTLEYIGIPSRISVSGGMFSSAPVSHMMYFAPPHEIHRWLRDEGFLFLLGEEGHTEEGDLRAIRERHEKAEKGGDS